MREITELKEVQKILLQIMDYIDTVCNENNLRYYLAGGTLLGAIRHKGFIPWDDDVDISMPREDYEKLRLIIKKSPKSRYKCIDLNENNYHLCFYKIVDSYTKTFNTNSKATSNMGVFVDIFPIDGFGNDLEKAKHKIRAIYGIVSNVVWSDELRENEKICKKIIRFLFKNICHFIGKARLVSFIEHHYLLDYNRSKYIGSTYGVRRDKEIITHNCFEQYKYALFENRKYRIPLGYDQYLKQMYGDYMKMPPIDQQVRPHSNERIFWRYKQ